MIDSSHQSLEKKLPGGEASFSFFRAPIQNTVPCRVVTVSDVYRYLTGEYARVRTARLREITDRAVARKYKATQFDYCTFSGVFERRGDAALVRHSGLMCLDFDHLAEPEALFARLLTDRYFPTKLLFRSPSGDGLKWVIGVKLGDMAHADYFDAVRRYVSWQYGVEVDATGRDGSGACFWPYDADAYVEKFSMYPQKIE